MLVLLQVTEAAVKPAETRPDVCRLTSRSLPRYRRLLPKHSPAPRDAGLVFSPSKYSHLRTIGKGRLNILIRLDGTEEK